MQMTHSEIVNNYRDAKNKSSQIQVLAELNACTPEYIKKILKENGAFKKPGPKPKLEATFKKDDHTVKEPDKEEEGCLKDKKGSCAGCDETDLCLEYVSERSQTERRRIPMPDIMKEAVGLGIEALDEKIKNYESDIETIKRNVEELKTKKRSIEEYMKRSI